MWSVGSLESVGTNWAPFISEFLLVFDLPVPDILLRPHTYVPTRNHNVTSRFPPTAR